MHVCIDVLVLVLCSNCMKNYVYEQAGFSLYHSTSPQTHVSLPSLLFIRILTLITLILIQNLPPCILSAHCVIQYHSLQYQSHGTASENSIMEHKRNEQKEYKYEITYIINLDVISALYREHRQCLRQNTEAEAQKRTARWIDQTYHCTYSCKENETSVLISKNVSFSQNSE